MSVDDDHSVAHPRRLLDCSIVGHKRKQAICDHD